MAKLHIYSYPDNVLTKKAQPVARVEKTLYKVADDMLETMYEAPGIGLAANQVGILERIIVVDTEYNTYEPDPMDPNRTIEGELIPAGGEVIAGQIVTGKRPIVLINPEIIYSEGTTSTKEACLSVPDYQSEVKRAEKIRVRYQDIDGLEKVMAAEGLQAVCLQHEIDHLNGKLFIDHLNNLRRKFAQKKVLQIRGLKGTR